MFYGASAFNQDISNWNVSSGTSFVSSKEVESVNAAIECESSCGFFYFLYTIHDFLIHYYLSASPTLLLQYPKYSMFYDASAFNQDICAWKVKNTLLSPTPLEFCSGAFSCGSSCSW